ncbi:hypothetical protein HOG17_01820 [Candidatus Peregrinibacteria bacterium]|nr:hypothetical protein [Candidatus Peregrinibacteria bacterium]MBT4148096.1 hypothetical protein [Candidatus Peregrinibacteria bacterium]MBT4365859.1 hypothetical protein [Candidatus Peregrinibacteria bacterium]MBT4456450.1 hypothetical protein [Candidatus Peregrinibacteria bacterium]
MAHTLEPPPKKEIPIPANAVKGPIRRGHPLYEEFQTFYHHEITAPLYREIMYYMSKLESGKHTTTAGIVANTSVPNTNTATVLIKTKLTTTKPFYIEQVKNPDGSHQKLLFLCHKNPEEEEENIIPENIAEGPITKAHPLSKNLENFLRNSKGGTHERIIRILAASANKVPTTMITMETATGVATQTLKNTLDDLKDTRPFYIATRKYGKTTSLYLCYEKTKDEDTNLPPETPPSAEKSKNPIIKTDPLGTKKFLAQCANTKATFKVAQLIAEDMEVGQRTTYEILSKKTGLTRTYLIKIAEQLEQTQPYKLEKYLAEKVTILKLAANPIEKEDPEESEISEEEKELFLEWKTHPSLIGKPTIQTLIDYLSKYPIGSRFEESKLAEILEIKILSFKNQVAPILAETEPLCLILVKGQYQAKRPEDDETGLEYQTQEDKIRRRLVLKLLSIYGEETINPLPFEPEMRSIDDETSSGITALAIKSILKLERKLKDQEFVVDQICRRIDLLIENIRSQFKDMPEVEKALKSLVERERQTMEREIKFKLWQKSAKGQSAKKIVKVLSDRYFQIGDELLLEDLARLAKVEPQTVKQAVRGSLANTTPLGLKEKHERTGVFSYTITENETKEANNGIPEIPIFPVVGPIHPSHPLYPALQQTLENLGNAERIKEILQFLANRYPNQTVTYQTVAEKTDVPSYNVTQATINMHLDEETQHHKTAPFTVKKSPLPGEKRKIQIKLWCRAQLPKQKERMRKHPSCNDWIRTLHDPTMQRLARTLVDLGPNEIISTDKLIRQAFQGKITPDVESKARTAISGMLRILTNHPEIQITRYIRQGTTYLGTSLASADVTEWAAATPRKEIERKMVEAILERFFTSRSRPITFTKKEVKKISGLKSVKEIEQLIEVLNKAPNFKLMQSPQDKKEVMFVSAKREITDDLTTIN